MARPLPLINGGPVKLIMAVAAASELFDSFQRDEWREFEEETVRLLQQLIQLDTQNFGEDGSEMLAVDLLKEKFETAGVPYEIAEPKPGRGNIIARIHGDGTSGKGALCLSAHLDTVLAPREKWEEEGWKHDPFGGEIDEEDGCLYGRGAIDMKNMAALSASLLCFIKRNNITLSRDLIFAGLADEERHDSYYGVKYLVENRPELIEADIVMTEVGGMSVFLESKEIFPVMVGEKTPIKVKLLARGPGGHGSIYHKDNPIGRIGEACHRLSTTRLPLRVTPLAQAQMEELATLLPFIKAIFFRQLLSPRFSDWIVDHLLTDEQINSLVTVLHNTANPVIISGGQQPNQIPSVAWALLDCRLVPGCSCEEALDDIRTTVGQHLFLPTQNSLGEEVPPELEFEVDSSKCRPTYKQDLSSQSMKEVLGVIKRVIAQRADGASIITNILPGGTDLAYYAKHPTKTPVCLGFNPVRLPPDLQFSRLFHGVNERIPVEGFKWGLRVLADVTAELCGAKR